MAFCVSAAGKGKRKVGVLLLSWQKAVNLRFTNYYLLLRGDGEGGLGIYDLRLTIYDCGGRGSGPGALRFTIYD